MTDGYRAPRTVHIERLGYALHAGDFVHIKEERGRDRGELKVYRILKFSAETKSFLGEYWEQPRFEGSSLVEHSFDTDGYNGHKELPEIVLTPETWDVPLNRVDSRLV